VVAVVVVEVMTPLRAFVAATPDEERAAIVRWLREEAARLRKAMFVGSRAYVLESTAYLIENGVHAEHAEQRENE
jgi:hypothetical protein